MRDNVHLTVAAVIEREHRFLCVREFEQGRLVINQPAGHVEPGESLIEAVHREALEETGWRVQATAFLGFAIYTRVSADPTATPATYYRAHFACAPRERDAKALLAAEIHETLWLSAAEIRQRAHELRSPMVLRAVEDYLFGPRYPLGIFADCR